MMKAYHEREKHLCEIIDRMADSQTNLIASIIGVSQDAERNAGGAGGNLGKEHMTTTQEEIIRLRRLLSHEAVEPPSVKQMQQIAPVSFHSQMR